MYRLAKLVRLSVLLPPCVPLHPKLPVLAPVLLTRFTTQEWVVWSVMLLVKVALDPWIAQLVSNVAPTTLLSKGNV